MRRHLRILIAVILAILLVSVLFWAFSAREPAFAGRPLSAWLLQHARAVSSGNHEAQEAAEKAIHAIGTNALPTMFAWITKRDSATKKFLMAKWPFSEQSLHNVLKPAGDYHSLTTYGCGVLKSAAKPLVPGLVRLLKSPDPAIRDSAAFALCQIGPAAEEALPSLLVTMSDPEAQNNAFAAVRSIGIAPEVLTAHLANQLSSTNADVRWAALAFLGAYGTNAVSAMPRLTNYLSDPDPRFRENVTNVLRAIAAQTVAKIPAN